MQSFQIRNVADIETIQAQHTLQERLKISNTYDLIQQGCSYDPQADALSFIASGDSFDQPITISYQTLLENIRQCANLLHSLGIGANDVVSYLLPNLIETHSVLWGAEAVGIVNPINPLLEPETIKGICVSANTRVLVALGDPQIWDKVLAIKDKIPTLKTILCISEHVEERDNILNFHIQVSKHNAQQLDFSRTIDPDDISSLYHTGGTTGTPKLAKRTHYNEVSMAWMLNASANVQNRFTILCGLPMFHVNATTVTGLCPFLVGAHVVILSPSGFRDPSIVKNFYKIVEHYQASFFSSVPTVLSALLEQPVGGAKIDSLNYAICGAAPLSTELFKRFEKHTGVKILEGYGLTEGACASAVNPRDGERKIGSIGLCMPYQRIQVGILDQDHQYVREANIGEAGNILIKGPNVFKGYVEPLHNQHAWVGDGWFNTGDLGRQDEDGYFWLTGRKKELIIRGGHNIDPQLIEEVFYQLDEVKLVAAVPSPHPRVGEVPVVYVQLVEGRTLSIAQLQEHAEKSIGERAAIPKQIFIIDSIPLTPVGKMFKPALRWDATKRAYQFALSSIQNQETKINITVGEDKTYGTRVDIFITSPQSSTQLSAAVRELLAPYSIHYELHFNAKS